MEQDTAISRIFLSAFLFACAVGMNFVIFPAILLKNQIDPLRIGIASSTEIVGGIFMSFILTKILRKVLVKKFLNNVAILYSSIIAIIFFYRGYYLWLLLILLIGMCWTSYTVIRQTWLNTLSSNQNRSTVAGLYSAILSIGIGFGPILVKLTGTESYYSFALSAFLVLASLLIINQQNSLDEIDIEREKNDFLFFLKTNPRCYLARFFFDLQNYCLLAFGVVFGKKIGLSAENSGLLITAFMSSFFADFLVGLALKKYNAYKMVNIGFLGYLAFISMIGLCYKSYKILLFSYFMLGIFAALIHIATIVIVNNSYTKNQLMSANSALQSAGSSGSFLGGILGGILINIFSENGYILTIILSCSFYLIFLARRKEKTHPSNS